MVTSRSTTTCTKYFILWDWTCENKACGYINFYTFMIHNINFLLLWPHHLHAFTVSIDIGCHCWNVICYVMDSHRLVTYLAWTVEICKHELTCMYCMLIILRPLFVYAGAREMQTNYTLFEIFIATIAKK